LDEFPRFSPAQNKLDSATGLSPSAERWVNTQNWGRVAADRILAAISMLAVER